MRIAVLHPGEMGVEVARALVHGGHQVAWRPEGRSASTRSRADDAGLVELSGRPGAAGLEGCDVVLSVCPPAYAVETARSVGRFAGVYVDANAVSPQTAREVAAVVTSAGATYVDGGIIGPPPLTAGTTRLYLSGAGAGPVADLFAGSALEAVVLETSGSTDSTDAADVAASALKMAYAAWTKGGAALLLATRAAAAELGVWPALAHEWGLSQPGAEAHSLRAQRSATAKGWRWAEEMRQIAQTFESAGEPSGFARAAAEVYDAYPRP